MAGTTPDEPEAYMRAAQYLPKDIHIYLRLLDEPLPTTIEAAQEQLVNLKLIWSEMDAAEMHALNYQCMLKERRRAFKGSLIAKEFEKVYQKAKGELERLQFRLQRLDIEISHRQDELRSI
ncbi:MAG: hypothetical protein Q9169_007573 [Polycauliona sp. 2 TL-2023]